MKSDKKRVVILGSTGSLGTCTLKLLDKYKKYFEIVGLTANENEVLLTKQANKFKVKNCALASKDGERKILDLISKGDIIVNVLSGIAGIEPSKKALRLGKILLLGNKESLVAEGEKVMRSTREIFWGAKLRFKHRGAHLPAIIPLDSEHNAIYEILKNYEKKYGKISAKNIEKIILPCSGGPFLNFSKKQLEKVTAKQALKHPRWKMGKKISLESATLINKGMEIIEAHYLFDLPLEKIKIAIHPQCIVHGIVRFKKVKAAPSATIAYLAKPNMHEHLENALLRSVNLEPPRRNIKQIKISQFKFGKVPHSKLPGIKLVLKHFKQKSLKSFLGKEEKVLKKFLNGKMSFPYIFKQLEE